MNPRGIRITSHIGQSIWLVSPLRPGLCLVPVALDWKCARRCQGDRGGLEDAGEGGSVVMLRTEREFLDGLKDDRCVGVLRRIQGIVATRYVGSRVASLSIGVCHSRTFRGRLLSSC